MFADPLTCQPSKLVDELSATYQGSPIIGGLLSGGDQPGEHTLFAGLSVLEEGAVGLAMTGNIEVNTIISQGCRPIGRPVVVTQVQDNLLITLGGQPALAFLHEVLRALPRQDQDLAQHGAVLIGLVINEMRSKFSSGDFLIRSILGIEPELGALAISDRVFVGQTVQFQLHDPATARQQLRQLLQQVGHSLEAPPAGGLLFNCTGRGRSLYGMSHQDVKTIQLVSGKMPIGGFFCNGEIGPVGGINLLHGYTASLGLFRPSTSGLGKP
ncbi:MAG: FIST C-terminal domain-containing protein [Candidatus Omnitrophica bacterium]|nr:FIST C-terminal domain-containing protein [Candidatus Omnitrophota bacterium]